MYYKIVKIENHHNAIKRENKKWKKTHVKLEFQSSRRTLFNFNTFSTVCRKHPQTSSKTILWGLKLIIILFNLYFKYFELQQIVETGGKLLLG
jgi:hypothetical protein